MGDLLMRRRGMMALENEQYVKDGLFAYYDFSNANYDPATSKYSPIAGSGNAFVATAYNNNAGKGSAHTADNSGMAYVNTSGIPSGDFTIEFAVSVGSAKPNNTKVQMVSTAIDFYASKLELQASSIQGAYVSATGWLAENILGQSGVVHLMLVYTSADNKLTVYKNNVSKGAATGNSPICSPYICTADVAEKMLRIYSKALSADERQQNYNYFLNNEV